MLPDDLITSQEARVILGISKDTFYDVLAGHELQPYKKDGDKRVYFSQREVERLFHKRYPHGREVNWAFLQRPLTK